jgi:hypothetical protein
MRDKHGERKKCDFKGCNKSYASQGDLRDHQKSHLANYKIIKCSECSTTFTRQPALNLHMKLFHNPYSKKFPCIFEDCRLNRNIKPLKTKASLFRHLTDLILWIEIDEKQHSSYNSMCELKRITDAYDNFSGKQLVVIRFNPDKYVSESGNILPLNKRIEKLRELIITILDSPQKDLIYIYYMYYNFNSDKFPENINYESIQ